MAVNGDWILTGKGGIFNGCTFPVQAANICIGTDPNICAVIYPAGTPGIAPLHCQITLKNNEWLITDFSDSGTWVNSTKLIQGQLYTLNAGDSIILGNSQNVFTLSGNSVNPSPLPTPHDETFQDKFLKYEGRLNRKPYILRGLMVLAASFIVSFILAFILILLGISEETVNIIVMLCSLPFSAVSVMLGIRRLHDTNHSGWWLLAGIIPVIGWIYVFYLLYIKKGTEGINRFGVNPLSSY